METHVVLLTLGCVFLAGVAADSVGRRTRVPRVTLLLLIGVAIGPSGLDLLPTEVAEWYDLLSATALTLVSFLLGNALTPERLRAHGRQIIVVSVVVVLVSIPVMAGGLWLAGAPLALALVMAGIATATAPAATYDVVRESGSDGPFTDLMLGIVAVDDAWGLIAFSLLLIAINLQAGDGAALVLQEGLRELGGTALLGVGLGVPAAYLTGRLRPGEPMQAEALGIVFLCAGLAIMLDLSFLLAGMIAGTTVANLARHHERAFHEIERIEWPFMLMFFILAGATFEATELGSVLTLVLAFVALRVAARILGGALGGRLAVLPTVQRRWIGAALMPQAGVSIGMALVAGEQLPHLRDEILALTIATTIVFEIFGPLATMAALHRSGEVGKARPAP